MNPDAELVLEGVRAKIRMADEQIRDLCEEIRAFEESQKQHVEHIAYQDRQEFVFAGDPKCPIEWSIRVGDIAYKLRSALDHLVTHLVLSNGNPISFLTRRHQFPIFQSSQEYLRNVRDYLKGVDGAAESKIHSFQPFNAPKDNLNLWSLHCLNIIDKHRYIRIMNAYAFGPPALTLPKGSSRGDGLNHIVKNLDANPRGLEPLQNGLCLFRYSDPEPAFNKSDFSFQVSVLFDDAVLAQGKPFISLVQNGLSQTYSEIAEKGPRGSVKLVLENLSKIVSTLVEQVAPT